MFSCYEECELSFRSDLKDYLIENNRYGKERIRYCQKYNEGAFTTNVPIQTYINCDYINGYPHFDIEVPMMLREIENYISGKEMYDCNVTIRYGDTHPHKPIPKLAQIRGIAINDVLNGMILTSRNKESIYMLGDVSQRSLEAVFPHEEISQLRKSLMMGNRLDSVDGGKYSAFVNDAKKKIEVFLNEIGYGNPIVELESELYRNRDIYEKVSRFTVDSGFCVDGTLKYVLQEMIYICNVLRGGGKLFSILGSNQYEHVLRVNSLMKKNELNYDASYIIYGYCFEAGIRDKDTWEKIIEEYISSKGLKTSKGLLDIHIYLNLIFACQNNSVEIHFDKLSNYDNIVNMYLKIRKCYEHSKTVKKSILIDEKSDLLAEMALVHFNIHYAVSAGEQSQFFRYLYSIAQKYNKNPDNYSTIAYLIGNFMQRGLGMLNLLN